MKEFTDNELLVVQESLENSIKASDQYIAEEGKRISGIKKEAIELRKRTLINALLKLGQFQDSLIEDSPGEPIPIIVNEGNNTRH